MLVFIVLLIHHRNVNVNIKNRYVYVCMYMCMYIIIIMVISKSYFSIEHIALSYKKWCEHGIRKNQQIKSNAHDGKSY